MNYDGLEPVAAWQPLYAPSFQDSLWNWRNGMAGIGVAPAFHPATGWAFNGSTQYLDSSVYPASSAPASWSLVVLVLSAGAGNPLGTVDVAGATGYGLFPKSVIDAGKTFWQSGNYFSGFYLETNPNMSSGVMGLAGLNAYRSGIREGATGGASTSNWHSLGIGRRGGNSTAGNTYYFSGIIQSVAVYDCTLTAAQVWQRSMMMRYLENPDWNAWSPARQWFFAPPRLTALWAGVGRNSSPVGGSLGVHKQ